MPIVVSNERESVSRTKEMLKIFNSLGLAKAMEDKKPRIKKGLRRSTHIKHYKKSVLLIVSKDDKAVKAARNMAGVDACALQDITANLLAPGGAHGRITVWSEHAIRDVDASIKGHSI